MRKAGYGVLLALVLACAVIPAAAIGFDPRGAREADGLSREFDDATRLQQLQQAPQLEPPPLVEKPKPSPPPEVVTGGSADPSALLQAMPAERANRALQQAEQQMQREQRDGAGHAFLRFLLWSGAGMALTWAVWSWVVRRASSGVNLR